MTRPLLLAVLCCVSAAQAQIDLNAPVYRDSSNMRRIGWAVHDYADKHGGRLPADLAGLATVIAPAGEPFAQTVRDRFMAPGLPGPKVPEDVGPAWLNQHSSYVYLGRGDLTLKDVPLWDDVVIAHLKLEHGYNHDPMNPQVEGEVFTLVKLDGGVFITPRAHAEEVIAYSRRVIDAMATGGPLPESFEVMIDLATIQGAVAAYAKAHDDSLPPDFGSLLAYVPETRRTRSLKEKACVFLPPRVEKNLHIPEEPTAEWVNRHAGYVYLGVAGAKLSEMDFFEGPILAMTRPEDAIRPVGGREDVTAIARARGVEKATPECIAWAVPYTRQVMEASIGKGAWPDLAHALRDLKFIDRALHTYVEKHDGKFPPDLGALLEHVPAAAGATAAAKARVFLSPRVERVTPPPPDLTMNEGAAWVREHASYVSLIPAGLTLKEVRRQDAPVHVLVYAPLTEAYSSVPCNFHEPLARTPALNWGWVWAFTPDHLAGEVERTKKDIAELRAKK